MKVIQTTLQLEQDDDVQLIGHGFKLIVKNGGNYQVSVMDVMLPDGNVKTFTFRNASMIDISTSNLNK